MLGCDPVCEVVSKRGSGRCASSRLVRVTGVDIDPGSLRSSVLGVKQDAFVVIP